MTYEYIINPTTLRKCHIHSKKGLSIIKNYLSQSGGAKCKGKRKTIDPKCEDDPACEWTPNVGCHEKKRSSRRTPRATSHRRTPRATSPRRTPRATSHRRTPRSTSHRRTPRSTSPRRTPRSTSPRRTPRVTSPRRTPRASRTNSSRRHAHPLNHLLNQKCEDITSVNLCKSRNDCNYTNKGCVSDERNSGFLRSSELEEHDNQQARRNQYPEFRLREVGSRPTPLDGRFHHHPLRSQLSQHCRNIKDEDMCEARTDCHLTKAGKCIKTERNDNISLKKPHKLNETLQKHEFYDEEMRRYWHPEFRLRKTPHPLSRDITKSCSSLSPSECSTRLDCRESMHGYCENRPGHVFQK